MLLVNSSEPLIQMRIMAHSNSRALMSQLKDKHAYIRRYV
jgi:hypothetical protein